MIEKNSDNQYQFATVAVNPAYPRWGENYDMWSMILYPINLVISDLRIRPDILTRKTQFAVNQTSLPESIQAISSAIVDVANTRTATSNGWGFSARLSTFAGFTYFGCVLVPIYIPPQFGKGIIEYIFVRFGVPSMAKYPRQMIEEESIVDEV